MDLASKRTYDSSYLTKTEAAEIVGLHPKTIEREIQRGHLRAFKPAGKIRIRRVDVDAWVESAAIKSTIHSI
jgi:excisionase family DNA binding protein